jgi:hypothetical protein
MSEKRILPEKEKQGNEHPIPGNGCSGETLFILKEI